MNLSPDELYALAPPDRLPVAAWIEKNRVLHSGYAAEPGPKKLSRTPFIIPILESWLNPFVREIVVVKSAQIGLTDLAVDLVGHTAANDPSPMAFFLADQLTAEKVMVDRVQTMLRSTESLRAIIDENRITKQEAYLRNGFNLTCSWSSSIAQTASRPFKHMILDEINKPGYSASGDEGSAIGRLRQRQETFSDSKMLMMSTPTGETGNISREIASCDVVYDWCVPCPHCGAFQPLRWSPCEINGRKTGGVVWEGRLSATPEQIAATARYQCGECLTLWTTAEKNASVSRGRSMPQGSEPERPVKVGFQLNRIMSLFPGGRLDKLVSDFIAAKSDQSDFQNFVNSALGEPWITYKSVTPKDELKKACCDLPAQIAPDAADCIVVTVDMQQTGFWYLVRAWSSKLKDSWMLECGQLGDWEDVENLLFDRAWTKENGIILPVWRSGLDIGGTKEEGKLVSRTEEAQTWWIANRRRAARRVFLCKGSSKTSMPTMLTVGKILETLPSGKKITSFGLQIIELNTNSLKDLFYHSLDRAVKQESGAAFLNAQTPDAYFKHITAEVKENDGTYRRINADNHWLDCEMMQRGLVSRELHGGLEAIARMMPADPAAKPEQKRPEPVQENPWMMGIQSKLFGGN